MHGDYINLLESVLEEGKHGTFRPNLGNPYYALKPFMDKLKTKYYATSKVAPKDLASVRKGYTAAQKKNPKLRDLTDADLEQYITGKLLPIELSKQQGAGWLSNGPGDAQTGILPSLRQGGGLAKFKTKKK